jgi:hypothetical protein
LVDDFWNELGVKQKPDAADLADLVERFIVEVILPVDWYNKKIRQAVWTRNAYFVFSVGLVIIVPLGVAYLPKVLPSDMSSASVPAVVSQLTAVLTGIFALQRVVGAWLSAQQRFGDWRKASADLKKIWYGFQTKWAKVDLAGHGDEFKKDLEAQRDQGRGLVDDEEDAYFQKLTLPSLDILDFLTKAQPSVTSLIGAILPGTTASASAITADLSANAGTKATARQTVATNTVLLGAIEKQITESQRELARASGDEKVPIQEGLTALIKRRDAVRLALMEARASVGEG